MMKTMVADHLMLETKDIWSESSWTRLLFLSLRISAFIFFEGEVIGDKNCILFMMMSERKTRNGLDCYAHRWSFLQFLRLML